MIITVVQHAFGTHPKSNVDVRIPSRQCVDVLNSGIRVRNVVNHSQEFPPHATPCSRSCNSLHFTRVLFTVFQQLSLRALQRMEIWIILLSSFMTSRLQCLIPIKHNIDNTDSIYSGTIDRYTASPLQGNRTCTISTMCHADIEGQYERRFEYGRCV